MGQRLAAQRGAILIMAAGLMMLLLGLVAFGVDVGHVVLVRNELQNTADSAALAGASRLLVGEPQAVQQAVDYAQRHEIDGEPIHLATSGVTLGQYDKDTRTFQTSRPANAVRIDALTRAVEMHFAKLFGTSNITTSQAATAVIGEPNIFFSPDPRQEEPPITLINRQCPPPGRRMLRCRRVIWCCGCPDRLQERCEWECIGGGATAISDGCSGNTCATAEDVKAITVKLIQDFDNRATYPATMAGAVPFLITGPSISPLDANLQTLATFIQGMPSNLGRGVNQALFSKTLQSIREQLQTVDEGGRVAISVFNARMGGPDCTASKLEAGKARLAGVVIHVIAVGQLTNPLIDPSGAAVTDWRCLQEIAQTTGGYFKHFENPNDAQAAVAQIADEVRATLPVSLVQ